MALGYWEETGSNNSVVFLLFLTAQNKAAKVPIPERDKKTPHAKLNAIKFVG